MKVLFAFTLLVAGVVGAVSAEAQDKILEKYDNVQAVQAGEDNYLYIDVRGNFRPSHNCPHLAFARSRYPLTDARTEAQARIAVASLLSGFPVNVWTLGCTQGPERKYPIMTDLQVFRP